VPALDLLDRPAEQLAVVELSSYQIADLATGPQVAVITNLFREHTDWHGSERAYRADKLRLLTLPGVSAAVLNGRDEQLAGAAPAEAAVTWYGVPAGWDATVQGVRLGETLVLEADALPLRGVHNALNVCAALTALEAIGLQPLPVVQALSGFAPLPHRLQTVAEREGAIWVDDSISTTPESTLAALASFPGREIVLIAGGQDRGQDFDDLARSLAAREVTVIGVPSTGQRLLAAALDAGVRPGRAIEADDLHEAVALARELALPGVAVLLSPAAPSYDSYRDFEERGERFRALAVAR
jgi:UDP-N-acetylmuramoylalanine--D-glutamate ligase